jgi:DNA segregation ATPase FtsK/SpoIIIE, S-DNA-T family
MRLALTVVSPTSRTSANLVLEADAETEVGVVADELARLGDGALAPLLAAGAGGTGGGARVLQFPSSRVQAAAGGGAATAGGHAAVFVDGRPVNPRLTLAESPLREGCVVSLGDPAGCVPPEPTGIVEIRAARRRDPCTG